MENKNTEPKEEKIFSPFALIVLPCFIIYTLYRVYDRFSAKDMDAAIMFFIAAAAAGFLMYYLIKVKK